MNFNRSLSYEATYRIKLSEMQKLAWGELTKMLISEMVGEFIEVTCTMFEGYYSLLMVAPGSTASNIVDMCEPQLKISEDLHISNCSLWFDNNHIKRLFEENKLISTTF